MSQEEPKENEQTNVPQPDEQVRAEAEETLRPSEPEKTAETVKEDQIAEPVQSHSAGYDNIKSEIRKLREDHKSGESYSYRSFFNHAKQIIDIFKHTRDISDSQRKELWDEYRELCDRVDHLRKEEYSSTEAASHQLMEEILEELRSASELAEGVYDKTTFQVAKEKFKIVNNLLVARSRKMHRDDADHCWQAFRKGREVLDEKLKIVHSASLDEAKTFYTAAQNAVEQEGNPFDAMKIVIKQRENTKDLILSKEDTDIIVAQFNALWKQLTVRLDEFKKVRKVKRAERSAKRREWVERQKENREKNIERADKLTKLIETIAHEIAELEAKKETATTDEFREKIEGWIVAKQNKLEDFKKVVAGIHSSLSKFSNEAGKEEEQETGEGDKE